MLLLLYLLFGKCRVKIHAQRPEAIITAMLRNRINARNMRKPDGETLEFVISRSDRKRLEELLEGTDGEIVSLRERGLLPLLSRYKTRWGLLVGAAVFSFVLFLSTQVIWRIDLSGNERMSREELLATLHENGVYVGAAVGSIDIAQVQHRCVLSDERIAWLSLNRVGTIMQVELRESLTTEEKETEPANVVAACDAQIDSVEVHAGICMVGAGDSVRAGELLISGVVDGAAGGLREVRADGAVFGRVTEQIHVKIPFEQEKRCFTGREIRKRTLNFFGISINLFVNSGISMQKYDTMIGRKNLLLPDGTVLPVGIDSEILREYETEPVTLEPPEAVARACAELRRQTGEAIGDGELLARSQSAYYTEDAYVIDCELYVLKNIAQTRPLG